MYNYTSPITNITYYLNNCNNATFDASEEQCNSLGGHLVSYESEVEQRDAEWYYKTLGERARIPACCCSCLMPSPPCGRAPEAAAGTQPLPSDARRRPASQVPPVLLDGHPLHRRRVAQLQVAGQPARAQRVGRVPALGLLHAAEHHRAQQHVWPGVLLRRQRHRGVGQQLGLGRHQVRPPLLLHVPRDP